MSLTYIVEFYFVFHHHQIHQPPRRRHQNSRFSPPKSFNLVFHAGSAHNPHARDVCIRSEPGHHRTNLHDQLARRHQHQGFHAVSRRRLRLRVVWRVRLRGAAMRVMQSLDERTEISQGLARARWRFQDLNNKKKNEN